MDRNQYIGRINFRVAVFWVAACILLLIFIPFNNHFVHAACASGNCVPVLTISVSVNKTTASPGDDIIYTLTYRNSGDARATGIVIKNSFTGTSQNYLDFISADPVPDSEDNTWIIDGPLDYNKSGQITIKARIKSAFPSNRVVIRNQASIDSNETTPKYSNYVSVSVVSTCRLALSQSVRNVSENSLFAQSINAEPGDEVEFSLELKSTGTNQAINTKVWDNLSSRLEYISGSATINGSSLGGEVVGSKASIGDLLSGTTKTIKFRAKVSSSSNLYVRKNFLRSYGYADADICAVKTSTTTVVVTKESTSLAVITSSGLSINKLARNVTKKSTSWVNTVYANPGDEIEFLIKIKSTNKETNSVRVEDALPPKMTYISDSTTVDGNYEADGITTKNIYLAYVYQNLTRGIKFRVRIAPESEFNLYPISLANKSSAWGNDGKEISDTVKIIVNQPSQSTVKGASIVSGRAISVSKTGRNISKNQSGWSDSFSANPGDEIEFLIKVSNIGDTDVNNVKVRDNLLTSISIIGGSTTVDGVSWGGDVTGSGLNLGTLKKRVIKTIKFRAQVNSSDEFKTTSTTLINSAFVTGDDVSQLSDQTSIIIYRQGQVLGAAGFVKTGANLLVIIFLMIFSCFVALLLYCRTREEKLLEILNSNQVSGFYRWLIGLYFKLRFSFTVGLMRFKKIYL